MVSSSMTSLEMTDHNSIILTTDEGHQVNPLTIGTGSSYLQPPGSQSIQTGSSDNYEDDDDDDANLPPIKIKEALTYSLAITMAHETVGTFMFVYSIIAVATKAGATTTDVAFAISTAAFVYSHVFNKAHFNTWITVYLYLTDLLGRSFDKELIELYPEQYRGDKGVPRDSARAVRFMSFIHIICQLVGSVVASWLIWKYPGTDSDNMGTTQVSPLFFPDPNSTPTDPTAAGIAVAMILEFMITYALLYSLDIGDESNHRPGRSKAVFFSVGPPIVLFLGVRTVGDFTGASFNFARSFGPAVISGNYGNGALAYYSVAHIFSVFLALAVEQYRFKKHIRHRRLELQLIKEQKEQRAISRAQSRGNSRRPTTAPAH